MFAIVVVPTPMEMMKISLQDGTHMPAVTLYPLIAIANAWPRRLKKTGKRNNIFLAT